MKPTFSPIDEDARVKIRTSVEESLFVEAGAGTGKTHSLVDRIETLVSGGHATLDRVAAITFTEAAASELRDRIRERLEKAAEDPSRNQSERARCNQGVEDLDRAAIQTLHSFAVGLLRERPLEAGLPPEFETSDQIESDLAFEEAWQGWLDRLLDDADLEASFRIALSLGMRFEQLKGVAKSFHLNYDLLSTRSIPKAAMPSLEAFKRLVPSIGATNGLCVFAHHGDDDPLVAHVARLYRSVSRLENLEPGSGPWLRQVADVLPIKLSKGRQADWDVDPETGTNACKLVKDQLKELDSQVENELEELRAAALVPLLEALKHHALDYAERRLRQGRAEFHDQLIWARNLIRDNHFVRAHFKSRFTHILLDEAQDTDPIQTEVAAWLADGSLEGTTSTVDWTETTPVPGKLFVVGDPKQSIYRFRRADVSIMASLQELMGDSPVHLVQNFRSQRPVVAWVNKVFEQWMKVHDGQANYTGLVHRWEPDVDHPAKPGVWYIGESIDTGSIATVRSQEATAISVLLRQILDEAWPVLDRDATEREGSEQFRPAGYEDICILMPERTNLRAIELAMEDAHVPFRLEGASLVFGTQEIQDLLNGLRSIDDPSDQVALVASLRSPAYACSDADLYRFVEDGGKLDYLAEDNVHDGPVADAFTSLKSFYRRRLTWSPSVLLEKFIQERQLREKALETPRPRERWRRYDFLVGKARAFSSSEGRSLRDFIGWAGRQAEEGARVTEVAVPEEDDDAVRVMTVHGSKGLEFPIVILTGINKSSSSRTSEVLFGQEALGVRVGQKGSYFETPGFDGIASRDKLASHAEDVRLMYVAATRARDHLVVSMFQKAGENKTRAASIGNYLEENGTLWRRVPAPIAVQQEDELTPGEVLSDFSPASRNRWIESRQQLLETASTASATAATALAHEVKEEAGVQDEPWRRGRAGTSIGRAVHAVLQTVDLASGSNLPQIARAQVAAEGVPEREEDVIRLVKVALESDTLKRALKSGRIWREVPVVAQLGDMQIEGFIDLLFEEDGELVVVDYKTDAVANADGVELKAERYLVQIGGYS